MIAQRLMLTLALTLAAASVTPAARAQADRVDWPTYSGDYSGRRHSSLDQINSANVRDLRVEWVYQTRGNGNIQATPLVVDGVMYVTGPENLVYALDARTGRKIWTRERKLPENIPLCCGTVNRGVAVLGGRLFVATLDAHLLALDARTGNLLWDVVAADFRKGYTFTAAPLVLKDKVLIGVSGAEFGIRGFIDAYDARTGHRVWRFHTVPAKGEPGGETWEGDSWKTGGGSSWLPGTYDPELDLTFWGIGNPAPQLYGEDREGDNLYTNSVVALDPDTGRLRWHFQFTPHDVNDWDAIQIPVLLDAEVGGRSRKLLVQANRNGFLYVLDRTNGAFLRAGPFVEVNWTKGIGPDGRPVPPDSARRADAVCPGQYGGTNWESPTYDPATGLLYVTFYEQCFTFERKHERLREGEKWLGGIARPSPASEYLGGLRALDPRTGDRRWEFLYRGLATAGSLSTAGGLVFTGNFEGHALAFDAERGTVLWHVQTGAPVFGSPMTYMVDGRQHVALASGSSVFVFALPPAVP